MIYVYVCNLNVIFWFINDLDLYCLYTPLTYLQPNALLYPLPLPTPYPYLQVPYYFNVLVKRPIGLHVEEAEDKSVVVKRLTPELGAAKTRRIEVRGGQNYNLMHVIVYV